MAVMREARLPVYEPRREEVNEDLRNRYNNLQYVTIPTLGKKPLKKGGFIDLINSVVEKEYCPKFLRQVSQGYYKEVCDSIAILLDADNNKDGVVAIDFDAKKSDGTSMTDKEVASIKEAIRALFPGAPMKVGGRGFTIFLWYDHKENFGLKVAEFKKIGVDVLKKGQITVICGPHYKMNEKHEAVPSGRHYEWHSDKPLSEFKKEELPALTPAKLMATYMLVASRHFVKFDDPTDENNSQSADELAVLSVLREFKQNWNLAWGKHNQLWTFLRLFCGVRMFPKEAQEIALKTLKPKYPDVSSRWNELSYAKCVFATVRFKWGKDGSWSHQKQSVLATKSDQEADEICRAAHIFGYMRACELVENPRLGGVDYSEWDNMVKLALEYAASEQACIDYNTRGMLSKYRDQLRGGTEKLSENVIGKALRDLKGGTELTAAAKQSYYHWNEHHKRWERDDRQNIVDWALDNHDSLNIKKINNSVEAMLAAYRNSNATARFLEHQKIALRGETRAFGEEGNQKFAYVPPSIFMQIPMSKGRVLEIKWEYDPETNKIVYQRPDPKDFREGRPDDFCFCPVHAEYNPEHKEKATLAKKVLNHVFDNCPKKTAVFLEFLGTTLTNYTADRKSLFLVGATTTGKSVIGKMVQHTFDGTTDPDSEGTTISTTGLHKLGNKGHKNNLYTLVGKRLNITFDGETLMDTGVASLYLSLVADEGIIVNEMWRQGKNVRLGIKLLQFMNAYPRMNGGNTGSSANSDNVAAWKKRTIVLHTTKNTLLEPGEPGYEKSPYKMDPTLEECFRSSEVEMNGFFTMIVDAYVDFLNRGMVYDTPEHTDDEKRQAFGDNPVTAFINEFGKEFATEQEAIDALGKGYRGKLENGEHVPTINMTTLTTLLVQWLKLTDTRYSKQNISPQSIGDYYKQHIRLGYEDDEGKITPFDESSKWRESIQSRVPGTKNAKARYIPVLFDYDRIRMMVDQFGTAQSVIEDFNALKVEKPEEEGK